MLNSNMIIILFYIFERILELIISTRNKILLKRESELKILNKNESLQMKLFHLCWFVLLIYESSPEKMITGTTFYTISFVLIAAQVLRWSAIFTLGRYWSVDVYETNKHVVINRGLYSYIKHPNYLAVILELFFLPLLLGCPITLIVGTVINGFVLRRRIAMEEGALIKQGDYINKFAGKRKFI